MKVDSEHANPVIADWDGDGRWDIVSGSGDGGVYWYRNVGAPGRPEFAPPIALVPKHERSGYSELLDAGQPARSGIRSQIAVVDYDGDGKLDLLLGDFCTYLHVKPDLSPENRREFEAVRAKADAAAGRLRTGMEALRASWNMHMKDVPKSEWYSPANSAKWQNMYQEMRDSPAYKQNMAE